MQRKPISITTKKRLGKLLTHIGESEQQIEFFRQNLCKATSFEPYASFQRIDRANKGYLTPKDISNFAKDNGVDEHSLDDCQHVIMFFDSTLEGRVYYTE